MITDQVAVQHPDLMGRATVEETPVQASMAIRADSTTKVIKAARVVTISSSSRVIRATRSS